jgi:hypothetical protein
MNSSNTSSLLRTPPVDDEHDRLTFHQIFNKSQSL